jgi:hypothetical protein
MYKIRQWSVRLVILTGMLASLGGSRPPFGRYTGPRSLGPYSLDHDVSMKSFLAKLGAKVDDRFTYCFADKEHGIYLYVEPKGDDIPNLVGHVVLSSFQNCRNLPVLPIAIDPALWKTPEGIGLGSTNKDVLRAYHQPVRVSKLDRMNDTGVIAGLYEPGTSKADIGDSSYLYSCLLSEKQGCEEDARSAEMGFRNDKLVWISLSNSP